MSNTNKPWKKNLVSVIFMGIPCILSLVNWTYTTKEGFWVWQRDVINALSIKPSAISMLVAVALYSSVIIRVKGLHNSFNSKSDTLLSFVNIFFCASFLSFFCTGELLPIPFLEISGQSLLVIAIAASWLCMAAIAGFIWIILFLLSAARIAVGNEAMGMWGTVYIMSAFLGIIFQLKQQSAGFLSSLKQDFLSNAVRARNQVIGDMGASVQTVKNAVNVVTGEKEAVPVISKTGQITDNGNNKLN